MSLSPLVEFLEFGAFPLVGGQFKRPIHHHFQVNFFFDDLPRRHLVTFMQKISAADLCRVDAKFLRRAVHVHLYRVNGLQSAKSPESTVRYRVRHHNAAAYPRTVALVRPRCMKSSPRQHNRR